MDLSHYTLEDLLLTALKSEIDSNTIYNKLANTVKNGLLKDKFLFLAKEEEKHKTFVESLYKKQFPKKPIRIPKKTPVPLPKISYKDENIPLCNILQQAMTAEQAAHEFYKSLAQRYTDDQQINRMLSYFSDMELGHYKILEIEKGSMERFEDADIYWPMIHAGP
ncbi:MAG: ferritin family protein [Candidatus Thermoplasmatota archaeon]|nr:ferritin family protein [Candidatus Thermoplasmatota archaeon]MBU1941152.1 ferritin family protein [Candidatus Thermoplasmatota archaeon]